jgi:hypothetical protein
MNSNWGGRETRHKNGFIQKKNIFALFVINKNSDPKASRNILWHLHTNFSIYHIFSSTDSEFVSFSTEQWNLFWLLVEIWKYLRLSEINIDKNPNWGTFFGEFIVVLFCPLMKALNEREKILKNSCGFF